MWDASRFFVSKEEGEEVIVASSLHIELDVKFAAFLGEDLLKFTDVKAMTTLYANMKPQIHGNNFQGMYNDEVSIDLAGYEFDGVFFDDADNWAGFSFYDYNMARYVADTPVTKTNFGDNRISSSPIVLRKRKTGRALFDSVPPKTARASSY